MCTCVLFFDYFSNITSDCNVRGRPDLSVEGFLFPDLVVVIIDVDARLFTKATRERQSRQLNFVKRFVQIKKKCCCDQNGYEWPKKRLLIAVQTHMFVIDWFCEKRDDNCGDDDDSEEDAAEVQVVDVLDDGWPLVFVLLAARDRRVGKLPDESDQSDHQPDHETPERSLEENTKVSTL